MHEMNAKTNRVLMGIGNKLKDKYSYVPKGYINQLSITENHGSIYQNHIVITLNVNNF